MKPQILGLALLLSACSAVVPSGIAKLYQLTPLESDPADLAVALDLPESVRIKPGTAQISFNAKRSDTGQSSDGAYELEHRQDANGLTILAVAQEDQAPLRAQQAMIRDWEAENEEATSGSISVGFEGCKATEDLDLQDEVSVLLRTQEDGRFFHLIRDAPLSDVLQVFELEKIEDC